VKWAQGLFTGVMLLATPATGITVDCENAYTQMERAICTDPRLLEVERKLSAMADEALVSGQINRAQSRWLHDSLAQDCRRAQQINQCLLSVAEDRIQWLSQITGPRTIVNADF